MPNESETRVLLLCVLSVGVYFIIKLYKLTKHINAVSVHPIPAWFVSMTTVLFFLSYASLIHALVYLDPQLLKDALILHVVSTFFDVAWIIQARNRLNVILGGKRGSDVWLAPFATSLFHVIYMQYKINKSLDAELTSSVK